MNIIEKALFDKTKDFQEGQIYSDQWKFAKSYLPKVLDTISHVFPHYSLHNSTHSEAILNNIVKIVGADSIEKLSVVDLWLLLAAAYYHDCGMVVTGEDKKRLFEDESEFIEFVKDIQQDDSSPMHQYASLFEIRDNKAFYKNKQLTHESYESARFLLAAFIRDKHSERSGKRIETEESLHFPGDPIPERIIRILKSICDCHTKDVEEVMRLQPVESSGCGIEDCHPRFVAAMLRLGDLLDIDSNRISAVLLSTLGCIPSDSKFYNETNRAITHIRVDQSIIEITAECNDYHVADLVNRWLQWLNDELVFYMKRWHKIIPFKEFGYLPTVGDLRVNLSDYDTFDGKKRPSFEIDSSRAVELLQGAGLYADSCECIRELLQNSVDATYLRVYKENPGIKDLADFKAACEKYPIVVKLNRQNKLGSKDCDVSWRIEIIDKGIGMTKEDMSFLSKTGSSNKNVEKKKLIDSVPEYLWPSGAFGIGFQSVFLITDKVSVTTRKLNKDNYLKAELFNPSGKEKGAILMRSISKEDVDYGTTICFEFKEKIEGHQLVAGEDRYSVSEFVSYDFAKNRELNLIGMKVMDEVVRFRSGTFVPVDFILDGQNKPLPQNSKIEFGEIDRETGLQLCIDKMNLTSFKEGSKVYYRNQLVRDSRPAIDFLNFHINILSGSAKEVLTLDRSRIRREYQRPLQDNIKRTIIKNLSKLIDTLDSSERQLASMLLESYREYALDQKIPIPSHIEYWKSYEMVIKNEDTGENVSKTLDELLSADSLARVGRKNEPDLLQFNFGETKFSVAVDYRKNYSVWMFLIKMAQQRNYYLMFKNGGYVLSKTKQDIIEDTEESRIDLMSDYLRYGVRTRSLFPCGEKYADLRVEKKEFSEQIIFLHYFDYPCMICPFIRKFDLEHADDAICLEADFDDLVLNTAYEHRINQSVTKEKMLELYESFIKEWTPVISKVNSKAKEELVDAFYGYKIEL